MKKQRGSYCKIVLGERDHVWWWRLDVWRPEARIEGGQSSYKTKSSAKRAAGDVARKFGITVDGFWIDYGE